MKRIYLIISLLLVLCFQEISAQEKKWTLEDCINYAVSNNIGLKRQRLLTETAEVIFFKSEMDIQRQENEPPISTEGWCWRYHHIGIPTDKPRTTECVKRCYSFDL